MDAYQHVRKGVKYPAQLVTTGFNDNRVASFIPVKFAAKMQAATGSGNPVFFDVNYAAGHFGGATGDENYVQTANIMLSFRGNVVIQIFSLKSNRCRI